MPHHCRALLIHCMDFRLEDDIHKYLVEKKLLKNCDIVSLAGATRYLASGHQAGSEVLMEHINFAREKHQIGQVILLHHTDCGAYGGSEAFASRASEREHHIQEMKKSKAIILNQHPHLEVEMLLAEMDGDQVSNLSQIL